MATIEEKYNELQTVFDRAEKIFQLWNPNEKVALSEVWRVLNARYHYHISFSRTNTHVGADKNGYVTVVGADNEKHATEVARSAYGGYVKQVNAEYDFDPKPFKKGEIDRIVINGDEVGETEKVPVKS